MSCWVVLPVSEGQVDPLVGADGEKRRRRWRSTVTGTEAIDETFFCSEAKSSRAPVLCVVRCPHGERCATEHESAQSEIGHGCQLCVSMNSVTFDMQMCLWEPAVEKKQLVFVSKSLHEHF